MSKSKAQALIEDKADLADYALSWLETKLLRHRDGGVSYPKLPELLSGLMHLADTKKFSFSDALAKANLQYHEDKYAMHKLKLTKEWYASMDKLEEVEGLEKNFIRMTRIPIEKRIQKLEQEVLKLSWWQFYKRWALQVRLATQYRAREISALKEREWAEEQIIEEQT